MITERIEILCDSIDDIFSMGEVETFIDLRKDLLYFHCDCEKCQRLKSRIRNHREFYIDGLSHTLAGLEGDKLIHDSRNVREDDTTFTLRPIAKVHSEEHRTDIYFYVTPEHCIRGYTPRKRAYLEYGEKTIVLNLSIK